MNAKAAVYPISARETAATVRDVINVKTALATLLAEETAYMDTMQIGKVGDLQERKLKLTGLLERYIRYLSQHPEALARTTQEEKAELQAVSEKFQGVMRKNYEMLLVARAVNGAIVRCVTQTFTKKTHNPIYNANGAMSHYQPLAMPMTLNQTI